MAGNSTPILSKVGVITWGTIAAANTAVDGTGTVVTVFTADATNGGRVDRLRIKPLGTNVVTVMRVFINNGLTNATPANNILYGEVTLPATTITQVAALADTDYNLSSSIDLFGGLVLPPGYKLNVTLGTLVAAGFAVSGVGGSY